MSSLCSALQASSTLPPAVPRAFVTKCFPGLQQHHGQRQEVQLRVTVDGQPGADSSSAGARSSMVACKVKRGGVRLFSYGLHREQVASFSAACMPMTLIMPQLVITLRN